MAWNVKESEQSVNRQLVFRRKEMASQIVTTKKGSGQQTWNLSKNLHNPIFGQKNFTHWKRVNGDYFRQQ